MRHAKKGPPLPETAPKKCRCKGCRRDSIVHVTDKTVRDVQSIISRHNMENLEAIWNGITPGIRKVFVTVCASRNDKRAALGSDAESEEMVRDMVAEIAEFRWNESKFSEKIRLEDIFGRYVASANKTMLPYM